MCVASELLFSIWKSVFSFQLSRSAETALPPPEYDNQTTEDSHKPTPFQMISKLGAKIELIYFNIPLVHLCTCYIY